MIAPQPESKDTQMQTIQTPADDATLLLQTAQAVHQTGQILLERFNADLRQQLLAIRPQARWLEDEEASGPLPSGEWWVVDPVEGNVNHIHGLGDWSVTATLVRDNEAVLTVVDEPLTAHVYTALRGSGAFLNGRAIQASRKQELSVAMLSTAQAMPGEDAATHERTGKSIIAMLNHALLVKAAVPSTMQLIHVAAGRLDGFWQAGNVLSGLVSGALLVREAGGMVTDWHGAPWTLASGTFIASAPGIHAEVVQVLRHVEGE
jgi:myo-inositol-1(or 4)-monophosphatase